MDNILALVTIISAVSSLVLGIIVYLNDRQKFLNISFAVFSISLSFWAIAVMMQKVTEDVLWGRLIFIPIPFLVSSLLLFSIHFPVSQPKLTPKNWQAYALLITVIILLVTGVSPLVLKDVVITESGLSPVPGELLTPYYLLCGAVATLGISNLTRKYFAAELESKLRMQYLILGLLVMMVLMVFLSLIIPAITGSFESAFYAPSLSIILVAFTGVAIIKYRLMGIRFIAGKLIQSLLIGIIGFSLFNGIALLHTLLWGGIFTPGAFISGFLLTLIVGPAFIILNSRLSKAIDRSIIYSVYNPYELINDLLKQTSTELNLDSVIAKSIDITRKAFGNVSVGIVLFDRETHKVGKSQLEGFSLLSQSDWNNLLEVLNVWNLQESQGKKSEIFVLGEVIRKGKLKVDKLSESIDKVVTFMREKKVEVLLPLNRKVQLNGLMIVGNQTKQLTPWRIYFF